MNESGSAPSWKYGKHTTCFVVRGRGGNGWTWTPSVEAELGDFYCVVRGHETVDLSFAAARKLAEKWAPIVEGMAAAQAKNINDRAVGREE